MIFLKPLVESLVKYSLVLLALIVAQDSIATVSYDKQRIQRLIINEANEQHLSPALALAIAKVESDFNPRALSHAGAKGVMQIMPATAEQEFGISRYRLYDARVNIRLGIRFIKQLLAAYDQRVDIALSHYNGGSAVRDQSGRLSVIPATKNYVNKVLAARSQFGAMANRLSNEGSATDSNAWLVSKVREQFAPDDDLASLARLIPISSPGEPVLVTRLRQLRMHNITRGLDQEPQGRGIAKQPKKRVISKQLQMRDMEKAPQIVNQSSTSKTAPQQLKLTKRQKVLEWESVFN